MVNSKGARVLVVGRIYRGKWAELRAVACTETGAGEPHPDLFPELPPVPAAPAPVELAA
jgi:hypothetical protein